MVLMSCQATAVLLGSIEALKTQRDLYSAFRDLFVRHDRGYFLALQSSRMTRIKAYRRTPSTRFGKRLRHGKRRLRPVDLLKNRDGRLRPTSWWLRTTWTIPPSIHCFHGGSSFELVCGMSSQLSSIRDKRHSQRWDGEITLGSRPWRIGRS